jgi:hypothetical protein
MNITHSSQAWCTAQCTTQFPFHLQAALQVCYSPSAHMIATLVKPTEMHHIHEYLNGLQTAASDAKLHLQVSQMQIAESSAKPHWQVLPR